MTPEELKAIEARIRADDATAEDMHALLAYHVGHHRLTKLETRLAAAEKVVEAARRVTATDAVRNDCEELDARRLDRELSQALAAYDKLKEEK